MANITPWLTPASEESRLFLSGQPHAQDKSPAWHSRQQEAGKTVPPRRSVRGSCKTSVVNITLRQKKRIIRRYPNTTPRCRRGQLSVTMLMKITIQGPCVRDHAQATNNVHRCFATTKKTHRFFAMRPDRGKASIAEPPNKPGILHPVSHKRWVRVGPRRDRCSKRRLIQRQALSPTAPSITGLAR